MSSQALVTVALEFVHLFVFVFVLLFVFVYVSVFVFVSGLGHPVTSTCELSSVGWCDLERPN